MCTSNEMKLHLEVEIKFLFLMCTCQEIKLHLEVEG